MKRPLRWAAALGLLLATGYGGWHVLLRSEWLREQIRLRAIREVERATGGRMELGRFDFDPGFLNVTLDRIVLHGTEPASAPPLLSVDRVEVGLTILSFLRQSVDVGRINITSPRIHILVGPDGKTNLPSPGTPRRTGGAPPVEQLLKLAADSYQITNGEFHYADATRRFGASGRNLQVDFVLDSGGKSYSGRAASDALRLDTSGLPELAMNAETVFSVYPNYAELKSLRVSTGATTAAGTGTVRWETSPSAEFALTVDTNLTESARLFRAPAGSGAVRSSGRLVWPGGAAFRYEGSLAAQALTVAAGGIRVAPVRVSGRMTADQDGMSIDSLKAEALDGTFTGAAALPGYKSYRAEGDLAGFELAKVINTVGLKPIGYSGTVSGPITVEGTFSGLPAVTGDLTIAEAPGGVPLTGTVHATIDSANSRISFRDTHLRTPQLELDASGTLTQTLQVRFAARGVEDLQPALTYFGVTDPLPASINNGSVLFEGTVSGPLQEPLIAGQLRAIRGAWRGTVIDALSSTFVASPSRLSVTRFSVTQGSATASGSGTLALTNWKLEDASALDLRAEARSLNVPALIRMAGSSQPVSGLVNATVRVTGTALEPSGELQLDWFRPAYKEEFVDRIQATLSHTGTELRVASLQVQRGSSRITATGAYQHGMRDWNTGSANLKLRLDGLSLAAEEHVKRIRTGLEGTVTGDAAVELRLEKGEPRIIALSGTGRLRNFSVDKQPYGDLTLEARTPSAGETELKLTGNLREAPLTLVSNVRWDPTYPVRGRLDFGRLPFRVLNELRPSRVAAQPWPFIGAFRGSVQFAGPATDLDQWKVDVEMTELFARPSRRETLPGKATVQDFELRNDGPIRFHADGRTVQVRQARIVAKDTSLAVSGTFSLAERRPWDLKVSGQVDLAGVRTFSPDIIASGIARLEATVRGELASPQVFGAMELKDATLSVEDLPNGLDKVTGRVLFDRTRATIENRLTAESGGGTLGLSGFVDFAGDEAFYRLQADASRVRIRYPEGVSTVADASISLSGSANRSLLSGTVTVLRSGFTPRTDLGSLLAESSRTDSTPAEANPFLANMQLDVKARTGPDTQFVTSLTNDLQAEANLQIRGTGARPTALGRITVSQGDINFFGNKYTIKRGEVSFYNPTKVEPILDMDLDTRVRGVDVTVNFTGPIDKLNVSYRSDPPLQPSEIIALLTVGRSPTSSTVGSSQSGARGSFLETGANSLLGSAISAPISSQLQRFFGVSRIKIDPTISGLEGTPQARVTVEQQVSKDVTVTFVTNLNRSQQQVVRLEWNLNKEWSLIALRDENGSFGMDFQVRKQVK